MLWPIGKPFVDPGVSAEDNYDGDLKDKVVVTGGVDTTRLGTYTLSYNVQDSSGNAADTKTRTVTVMSQIRILPRTYMMHTFVIADHIFPAANVPNGVTIQYQSTGPKVILEAPAVKVDDTHYRMTIAKNSNFSLPIARALDDMCGYVPVFVIGYVDRTIPANYEVYYHAQNLIGGVPTDVMLTVTVK